MVEKLSVIENKIRKFYQLIKDKYPVKKILLYGSYAKNKASEHSDIDVGVVLDLSPSENEIKIGADLSHYSEKIDIKIEPTCIFWEEYKNREPASILNEIIITSKEIIG